MSRKKYDICVPRVYIDKDGQKKTHWWKVGMMTPMANRDGFSIMMFTNLLLIPKEGNLAAFVSLEQALKERENKDAGEEETDDDIPF